MWAAYYFIHSLSDTADYRERDMAVARGFSQAAKAAGVERIIYLGVWVILLRTYPRICARGRKPARPSARAACRSLNSVRRSLSAPAACRLR